MFGVKPGMKHRYVQTFVTCAFVDQEACHVPVLTNYVPAIKTWFDWMQQNISLLRSSSVRYEKNC